MSYLLLADDSLILFRANGGDAQQLQSILNIYEECSGQMINKEKSAIRFSTNTSVADRQQVCQILWVPTETMNERYLGLPVFVGRSKSSVFAYLKERVWRRIQGVERKIIVKSRKGNFDQGGGAGHPHFCYGLF